MFNILKNNLITEEFHKILENKYLLLKNDAGQINIKKHKKAVNQQIELLGFLNKEYSDQSQFLFKQVSKQFAAQSDVDIKANRVQREILQKFLDNDLKDLLNECTLLKNILLAESEALNTGKSGEYNTLLGQEKDQIEKLRDTLAKDGELEKTFARAYGHARQVDYNEFMSNLKHRFFKFYAENLKRTFTNKKDPTSEKLPFYGVKNTYEILPPLGVGNIPIYGPVLIAPRHYAADTDAAALYNAIPRRTFVLDSVDWIQTGGTQLFRKITHGKIGAIPINRPDATEVSKYYPDATPMNALKQTMFLLQSGESIIIFPEGWVSVGVVQAYKKGLDELLPAKEGFIVSVELAQKELKQKIPVIPTGIVVDRQKRTVQAVFGEPMYYETNENIEKKHKTEYRKAFGATVMQKIKELSRL